jgi:uncharacterized protein YvpB
MRIISLISVFLMAAIACFVIFTVDKRFPELNYKAADKTIIESVDGSEILTDIVDFEPTSASMPLDVPEYLQKYNASCETAAIRAAMLYFDVDFSEDDILEEIGWSNPPRYYDKEGNLVWGNPQDKFVGNPNPKRIYIDGYGVYNQPIYNFLADHGFRESISKTDWDTSELLNYVERGYPVIAWVAGDFRKRTPGIMISSEGVENPWIFAEHAVVIRGFNEKGIDIMDPAPGTGYRRITYKQFEDGFTSLGNMAIAVIPGEIAEL